MEFKIKNTSFTVTGWVGKKFYDYKLNVITKYNDLKILTEYVATENKIYKNLRNNRRFSKPRKFFESNINSVISLYNEDGSLSRKYTLSAKRNDKEPKLLVTLPTKQPYQVNVGTYEYYNILDEIEKTITEKNLDEISSSTLGFLIDTLESGRCKMAKHPEFVDLVANEALIQIETRLDREPGEE